MTAVVDGEESAGHTEHGSSTAATITATRCLAIAKVPIGARVVAENPRPEEFDDSFAEPVQSEWARVSFLIVRSDLSVVEAEFIRPRDWIESLGLVKGARLDLAVPELGIDGLAEVTAVRDCPLIAEGEGRVVTGKFVTRDVANVVRITLANGTEIRATDVHPVWSVDREDWVPASKLEPGELVDTLSGPVTVVGVEQLDRHPAVYNLEVHGEHVYRIAVDGVLVHNGDLTCLRHAADYVVTPQGIAISTRALASQGLSRLAGNFQGLAGKSMQEIIKRIPAGWQMVSQNRGVGVKFLDTAGIERIRIHAPSPRAPAGSHAATGWVLRIQDRIGNYYDDVGRIVSRFANEGHIPINGNGATP